MTFWEWLSQFNAGQLMCMVGCLGFSIAMIVGAARGNRIVIRRK
jgi:hypothetical protein